MPRSSAAGASQCWQCCCWQWGWQCCCCAACIEMTSWPPSWKFDAISKTRVRQSMRISFKNNPAKSFQSDLKRRSIRLSLNSVPTITTKRTTWVAICSQLLIQKPNCISDIATEWKWALGLWSLSLCALVIIPIWSVEKQYIELLVPNSRTSCCLPFRV